MLLGATPLALCPLTMAWWLQYFENTEIVLYKFNCIKCKKRNINILTMTHYIQYFETEYFSIPNCL